MGFCGRNNKQSARIAAFFGMGQGILFFFLDCFFLSVYFSTHEREDNELVQGSDVLPYLGQFMLRGIQVLLILAALLNLVWIISSFVMLKGNDKNNAGHVKQWVVVTGIILTMDILIPSLIIGTTLIGFMSELVSSRDYSQNLDGKSLLLYYTLLCVTVSRFGPVLLIVNIILNVFTNRRATDIAGSITEVQWKRDSYTYEKQENL